MPELPHKVNGKGGSQLNQPRYQQIFESLREQILQGSYVAGKKLPTEAELMRHFEVSRTTVSRAMRDLEQMGLVDRCRGSGTYVKERPKDDQLVRLSFFVPWVESDESLPYVEGLIYQRIARLASEGGCSISLHCFSSQSNGFQRDSQADMLRAAQRVISDNIDGVLYYPAELPDSMAHVNRKIVDMLVAAGIRVVLIDRDIVLYPQRSEFVRVGYDNRRSGVLLTNHLIASGCRRIVFVGIPEVSTAVADRLLGYREAHQLHGLPADPSLVLQAHEEDLTLDYCRELMKSIQPDAIVGKMDRYAAIIGRHLNTLGIQVSSEVKLAGFDNDPISELLSEPLTSIRLPIEPFAKAAYTAIKQSVRNPEFQNQQIIIDTELIVRESTISPKAIKNIANKIPPNSLAQ